MRMGGACVCELILRRFSHDALALKLCNDVPNRVSAQASCEKLLSINPREP